MVAALKAIKVPNVRWPGGCFADEYHWRNGIGPRDRRPATLNPNWGGVIEPNTFGTHEFMDFVQQIGADAYLSINVGSGTPAEAADWLEYLTTPQPSALAKERAANGHPEPFAVADARHRQRVLGLRRLDDAGPLREPAQGVRALRAQLQHAAEDATHRRRARQRDTGYTKAVMEAWKNKVWAWDIEGISLHFYTVGEVAAGVQGDRLRRGRIRRAAQRHAAHGTTARARTSPSWISTIRQKKIALVVDEWGAWLAATPGSPEGFLEQQNSQRDALIAALNINTFARHADRVRGANIAQMVNVLQAMILTDKEKMVLTPTYHVFRMYVPVPGCDAAPGDGLRPANTGTATSRLPRVDAIAARDAQGKTWLAVSESRSEPVDAGRARRAGRDVQAARGETLSAPQGR